MKGLVLGRFPGWIVLVDGWWTPCPGEEVYLCRAESPAADACLLVSSQPRPHSLRYHWPRTGTAEPARFALRYYHRKSALQAAETV